MAHDPPPDCWITIVLLDSPELFRESRTILVVFVVQGQFMGAKMFLKVVSHSPMYFFLVLFD